VIWSKVAIQVPLLSTVFFENNKLTARNTWQTIL
jgi:hypothetical protein